MRGNEVHTQHSGGPWSLGLQFQTLIHCNSPTGFGISGENTGQMKMFCRQLSFHTSYCLTYLHSTTATCVVQIRIDCIHKTDFSFLLLKEPFCNCCKCTISCKGQGWDLRSAEICIEGSIPSCRSIFQLFPASSLIWKVGTLAVSQLSLVAICILSYTADPMPADILSFYFKRT